MYRVVWEFDSEASDPVSAARDAWQSMRAWESIANVFTVTSPDGTVTEVDLMDGRRSNAVTRAVSGTEGQDRESSTDTQDRDSYTDELGDPPERPATYNGLPLGQ